MPRRRGQSDSPCRMWVTPRAPGLVERWFPELTTKKLKRVARTSVRALNAERLDQDLERQTADQLHEPIARYGTRISYSAR